MPIPTSSDSARTRAWRDGKVVAENFPLEEVSDYIDAGDCLVWADLCAPDEKALAQLAEELSLDKHAVEDAASEHERPKATRYASHLFLTAYAIRHDAQTGEFEKTHVSAFALKRVFVTVRLDDGFDIEKVVREWDDNSDLMKYGPRALIHGFLDVMIDEYFDAIQSLDDQIEALEDNLFDDLSSTTKLVQRQTFAARKSLVQARRAVLPMREVVNTVMRRATEDDDSGPLVPYFEDLYDHVLRAAEWTESLRDMISSVFETNVALNDTRMNLIMKKLTAWAAIIAVPTAITGYFGQNVPYPGFAKEWGFALSIVAIIAIASALYFMFKRKDWL
jgi:magnesium transporter